MKRYQTRQLTRRQLFRSLLPPSADNASKKDITESFSKKCARCFAKQEFKTALAIIKEQLKNNPDSQPAVLLLSVAHYHLNSLEPAEKILNDLAPGNDLKPYASLYRGLLNLKTNNPQAADTCWKDFNLVGHVHTQRAINLCKAMLEIGEIPPAQESAKSIHKAIHLDRIIPAILQL